ncbi:MAG: hypothetical protein ACO22R_10280 [Chitinophagaceae bacterium]
MDPVIANIMKAASDNPDYQALANYLISRRSFPDVQTAYMRSLGRFTSPGFFSDGSIPRRGIVSLNANAYPSASEEASNTLSHELTHALEKQLINQYYEVKNKKSKTDLDRQFMDNFQKIIGSTEPEINKWLKTVAPDFAKKEEGYRATGKEALAFGVANSIFPKMDENSFGAAPAHIDPTIATTLMLLLDQAQRVQNQNIAPQGR